MEYSAFVTFADCEIKQQLLPRNGRPKNHSSSAVQRGWPPFGIVDQIQIAIVRTIRQAGKATPVRPLWTKWICEFSQPFRHFEMGAFSEVLRHCHSFVRC